MGADHVEARLRPCCGPSPTPAIRWCGPATRCTATRSRRPDGRKTRHFDDIVREIAGFVAGAPRRGHVAGRHPRRAHRRERHRVPRRRRRGVRRRPRRPLRDDVRPAAERPPEPRPGVPRRRADHRRAASDAVGVRALELVAIVARPPRRRGGRRRRRHASPARSATLDRPFRLASLTKPLAGVGDAGRRRGGHRRARRPRRPAGLHAAPPPRPRRRLPVRRRRADRRARTAADLLQHRHRAGRRARRSARRHAVRRLPREAVLEPLGMAGSELAGSPAHGRRRRSRHRAFLAELQRPTLLYADTAADAVQTQYPDLAGIVPGVGRFDPCPWGLGFEIRGDKSPHWTGTTNSPATFGHFGGAGTMMWVDPAAGCGLVALTDRPFDDWSIEAHARVAGAVRRRGRRVGRSAHDVQPRRPGALGDDRRRRVSRWCATASWARWPARPDP